MQKHSSLPPAEFTYQKHLTTWEYRPLISTISKIGIPIPTVPTPFNSQRIPNLHLLIFLINPIAMILSTNSSALLFFFSKEPDW